MGVGHGRLLLVCCLAVVVLTAVVAGDSAYSLSGSSSIETPTRNVSYEGQQYTLDAVSRITATDSVTITTNVPDDASYELNLRGPENQLISSERLTGDASHTFSYFGSGEAGTYAATIQDGGNTVAVYPIVISGYDVTVTTPARVDAGANVSVSATVTERDVQRHSELDSVQVVLGNDDATVQRTMTQTTGGTYEATVSTAGLDPSEYSVYVVVRGNATVRERAEILGVSDTAAVTVTDRATAAPTTEADTTEGAEPTGTEDDDTDGTAATTTEADTTDGTESTGTEDDPTGGTESTTGTTDSTSTPRPSTTATAPPQSRTTRRPTSTAPTGVLEPSTPGPRTTTGDGGPGFTVGAAVGALLAVGLWLRRR